jgi:hypothetical protein
LGCWDFERDPDREFKKGVVSNLDQDDMPAIVAYLASLDP